MRTVRHLFAMLLLSLGLAGPASAAVTITFWSHDFGKDFPHAFFTLRGVPDMGGPAVNGNYGFTARSVSPAILWGSVPGRLDIAKPAYMASSDAQFSLVLTDAQYAQVLALVAAWSEQSGDSRYDLNTRNCVHFVKEAARRSGLTGLDQPTLMKKPRSFLQAVAAANAGHVTIIARHGDVYLATLAPVTAPAPAAAPILLVRVAAQPPVPAA